MSRRRTLVGFAVVLLVGGAGAFAALRSAHGGSVEVGGPLAPPSDGNFFGVSTPADLGAAYSYGLLIASNRGDRAATLERVALVGAPRELELVGTYAQPREDAHAVGLLAGFPPQGASPARRDVSGFVVPPAGGARIVVGVALRAPGAFTAHGLRLWYRVASKRYRTDWPLAVRLCAPRLRWETHCAPPHS